jgi:hypothetical protein
MVVNLHIDSTHAEIWRGISKKDCTDGLYRLLAIKEKLRLQRQHIEDLDKHMSVTPRHHTEPYPAFY